MSSAPKETSPFLRALVEVVTGARHAHDMAELLVTEAVQQTLARVCKDYPLDYTQMLARYQAGVVTSCCHLFKGATDDAGRDAPTCAATTKAGKPCGKRPVMSGFCGSHLEAWREQREAQRRTDTYAASVRRQAATDPYAHDLQQASKKRTVSMAFPDDSVTKAL